VAANLEMVGFEYPTSDPLQVTVSDIQNFCSAIGDRVPVFAKTVSAPPTFAISLIMQAMTYAMNDPKLNLDYARVVHADQKFEHTRSIVAGDVLTVQLTVADIKNKMGNDFVTFVSKIFDAKNNLVTTSSSLLVARAEA
jgi:acyl dehydratase